MSDELVPVTTSARAKLHWAGYDRSISRGVLCGKSPWSYTQADLDQALYQPRKRTVVADLPPCKQCEKSRQRRIDGQPS